MIAMADQRLRPRHILMIVIFGCACFVRLGSAIHCYKCRSDYGGECSDPARNRVPTVDCEKQTPKATRCKKIIREQSDVTYITRDCVAQAETQDEDGCFETNNDDIYCRCSSDLCNQSSHLKSAALTTGLGIVSLLIASCLLR